MDSKEIIEKVWKDKPNYLKIITKCNVIAIVEDLINLAIEETNKLRALEIVDNINKKNKVIKQLQKENEEITKEHALVILENKKYIKDNYSLARQIEETQKLCKDCEESCMEIIGDGNQEIEQLQKENEELKELLREYKIMLESDNWKIIKNKPKGDK